MRARLDNTTRQQMEHAASLCKGVEGWLTDDEMAFLFLAARQSGGDIVEIGSWKGRSTITLAAGVEASGRKSKVYAVDWHKGSKEHNVRSTLPEFTRNIKSSGLAGYVVPMVMKSADAARKWDRRRKISMLWIDGSHEYEDVKSDLLAWEPFLQDGGIIAFHDTIIWEGPKRVVDESILRRGRFAGIGFVDNIVHARKTSQVSKNAAKRIARKLALRLLWIRVPSCRRAVMKAFFTQYR